MAGVPTAIVFYSKENRDQIDEEGNWNEATKKEFKKFLGRDASFASNNGNINNNSNNNNNNNNSNSSNNEEVVERNNSTKQIDRFCGGDINLPFAIDAFEDSDFVFISHDMRANGELGSIRGLMCVKKNHNALGDHEDGTLYIELICNAPSSRAAAGRHGTRLAGGKLLLNHLKRFVRESGGEYQRIALKALETVIPYYYKFGWRFISRCDEEERGRGREEDVARLSAALRAHYKANANMNDLKLNPDINAALVPFKRYLPDLNDEVLMRTAIHQNHEDWPDLPAYDQSTISMHVAGRRDNGYAMLWCLENEQGHGKMAAKKGGRRKKHRKKRTKKRRRKSKKSNRHRRTTKRNKKRRKRKGGNFTRKNAERFRRNSPKRTTRRALERGVNIMPRISEGPLKVTVEHANPKKIIQQSRTGRRYK